MVEITKSSRLSGLDHQIPAAGHDIRRYSFFVRLIKIILPLAAIGIIGLLVIYPQISHIDTAPLTMDDLTALREAEKSNRLSNPVYNTMDSKGNPVKIHADVALQNRTESDVILLTRPTAELDQKDRSFSLEATEGTYNQADKILTLKGGVVLKDNQENVLTTDTLTTSIGQGRAQSNGPATLTTPQGTIKGQSVVIDNQSQTTIFQGPAKAVMNQEE